MAVRTPVGPQAVHGEVAHTATTRTGPERTQCRYILAQDWLGDPVAPTSDDQLEIMELWVALNPGDGPPREHAGEAESIYFTSRLNAVFATDDGAAYDFAQRRLGVERVIDSVDVLRAAVATAMISADAATDLVRSMRAAGRHLRRVHPAPIAANYFLG
jgi:hypothetical protein